MMRQNNEDVYTTQQAARLLNLSVTTVQHLVEAGTIKAWKTQGGHRRIPASEIAAYKSALMPARPAAAEVLEGSGKPRVVVVEDNEMLRQIYKTQFASWELPIELRFCENGYQALIEIASERPDVLLTDIVMDGIDGYEVIKTILRYPELADLNIAILTGMSEQELGERGELPAGAVYFGKPINFDELRGYLRACCAQKAKRLRGRPA